MLPDDGVAECGGNDGEAGTEDADGGFDGGPDDQFRIIP